MCGIAGYIGQSKKPKLSYELITQLFDFLELRGTDAAGVWGTESGDGSVIYHKEPIKSSEFIKQDFWRNLRKLKMNLMLVHARATSRGNGHARTNSNNHPFVSADKRIGMIHNGTLGEADFLTNRYQTLSNTDSEVLLRMFEYGLDKNPIQIKDGDDICSEVHDRMNGIQDIWSVISSGAMAVAFGERLDEHTRLLYLFRNNHRPLWLADLRSVLGQVFFFSSPDIWYRAIGSSDNLNKVCSGSEKLIEVPTKQVWAFKIDKENPFMSSNSEIYRFNMEIDSTGKKWEPGIKQTVKGPQVKLSVISNLSEDDDLQPEEDDDLVDSEDHEEYGSYDDPMCDQPFSDCGLEQGGTEHEEHCKNIIDLTNNIEITTNNSVMEGSMPPQKYMEIIELLEQVRVDLESTLHMVE